MWPKYCIWNSNSKRSLANCLWGDERLREMDGDLKRVAEGAMREEKGGKNQASRRRRRRRQDGEKKKIQVKEANWVFQLLIGPAGLARGYHSKIQHLALWCCCDQMSTGWHKQNKRDWNPFRLDPSCLNPAHVPPSPWIILFLLVFMLVLSISLCICRCFALFLIILTEGITISSSTSNLCLPASLYSRLCYPKVS